MAPSVAFESIRAVSPHRDPDTGSDLGFLLLMGMRLSRQITLHDNHRVDCWWRVHSINSHFSVVDLIVPVGPYLAAINERDAPKSAELLHNDSASSPALARIINALCTTSDVPRAGWAYKLVLPTGSGTVSSSSFLEQRLVGCPFVESAEGFLQPLQQYVSHNGLDDLSLMDLIWRCGGLVKLDTANIAHLKHVTVLLSSVNRELVARLNTSWVLARPIGRKRVALVRGRPDMNAGRPIYRAVASLGMDLVIIDEPSHWLRPDTPENKAIREAFLETDMTEDGDGVVDRIVKSIRDYRLPIDGIFTVSDNFFVTVAKAATILGLPTNPVEAYRISTDKYLSRQLQAEAASHTARVSGVAELKRLLTATDESGPSLVPSFPMIVKPTKGWSSECVAKVDTLDDLFWAVDRACARHDDAHACVIEPYFCGPEVDANFIMLDGKFVFSEIADEPPCEADETGATASSTFVSTSLMLPSVLPSDEQQRIVASLHELLLKAGFRTGVMHCEARVINSKAEYRSIANGIVDLQLKRSTSGPATSGVPEPECKLLEINARPPGFRTSLAVLHTHGVNYYEIHALASVGDHARLSTLSRAFDFASSSSSSGTFPSSNSSSSLQTTVHPTAQCWSHMLYIVAPGTGVVTTTMDATKELMSRRPDLAKHIALAWDYFHPGDHVTEMTDGTRTYIAYVLVWTRDGGRKRVMELAAEVRRELRFTVGRPEGVDRDLCGQRVDVK